MIKKLIILWITMILVIGCSPEVKDIESEESIIDHQKNINTIDVSDINNEIQDISTEDNSGNNEIVNHEDDDEIKDLFNEELIRETLYEYDVDEMDSVDIFQLNENENLLTVVVDNTNLKGVFLLNLVENEYILLDVFDKPDDVINTNIDIMIDEDNTDYLLVQTEDINGFQSFYLIETKIDGFKIVRPPSTFANQSNYRLLDLDSNGKFDACGSMMELNNPEGYNLLEKFAWNGKSFEFLEIDVEGNNSDIALILEYLILNGIRRNGDTTELITNQINQTIVSWADQKGGEKELASIADKLFSDSILSFSNEKGDNVYNNYVMKENLNNEINLLGRFSVFGHAIRYCSLSSKLEEDHAIVSEDGSTITVHNASELVYHMAPGKHYILLDGNYDLGAVNQGLNIEYYHNGFINLRDVIIEGENGNQIAFETNDFESTVLNFSNSENITLRNLYMGHNPKVSSMHCVGGVLYLSDCKNVIIKNSSFFGCGTVGIQADNVDELFVSDSNIFDCTRNILEFNDVTNAQFISCGFENNASQNINIMNSKNINFLDSDFIGLGGSFPKLLIDNVERDIDILSDGNIYEISHEFDQQITITNCHFKGMIPSEMATNILLGDRYETDIFHSPLSYEEVIQLKIYYDKLPEEKYISEFNLALDIMKTHFKAYYDQYIVIMIIDELNDMIVISSYNDLMNISKVESLGAVLDSSDELLPPDAIEGELTKVLPNTKRYDGSLFSSRPYTYTQNDVIIDNGTPYYGYTISEEDWFNLPYVYMNAFTNDLYFRSMGEMVDIETPDEYLENVFLEYIIDSWVEIPDDGLYKLMLLDTGKILFPNNFKAPFDFDYYFNDGEHIFYIEQGD